MITDALAGTAATVRDDTAQVVKNTYNELKELIRCNFADRNDTKGEMALSEYESDPVTWIKPLKKVLIQAGADKDKHIIHAAKELMGLVKPDQDAITGTDQGVNFAERLDRIRQISRGGLANSDVPKYAGRPWFNPLIIFCSIVFPLVLLTIILFNENFAAVAGTEPHWQLFLSVSAPPVVCVAIMLALSRVYRNIGIGMILFVLVPLCSAATSLVSASLLLDTSAGQIVSALMMPQEKSDTDGPRTTSATAAPAKEDLKPLIPPGTLPEKGAAPPEAGPPEITGGQEHTADASDIGEAPKAYDFISSMGMKFVYIPGGSFMMGSSQNEPGRYSYETLHRVTLTRKRTDYNGFRGAL